MGASVEEELIRICGGDINDGGGSSEGMETVADVSAKSVGRVGVEIREHKAFLKRQDFGKLWSNVSMGTE